MSREELQLGRNYRLLRIVDLTTKKKKKKTMTLENKPPSCG
jgi:hypothetical protein